MDQGSLTSMRTRVLSAAASHGVFVREENGRLIEVTRGWAAPLIQQMSKSACRYALLGINNRKDHGVVLSRKMVNALQSFAAKAEKV